jgi:hypothetical protein
MPPKGQSKTLGGETSKSEIQPKSLINKKLYGLTTNSSRLLYNIMVIGSPGDDSLNFAVELPQPPNLSAPSTVTSDFVEYEY